MTPKSSTSWENIRKEGVLNHPQIIKAKLQLKHSRSDLRGNYSDFSEFFFTSVAEIILSST